MTVEKTPLEILESQRKETTCYSLIYFFAVIRYYVQSTCLQIAQHSTFETISLLIILANCLVLAMDDPTTSVQEPWQVTADYIFQALYTIEIFIKAVGMGFLFNKGAYIRDPWNMMDFTIVVFGYLSMLNINGGIDLKALRTFRVLRPLRTISSVEGLRVLMNALVTSLPLLFDTFVVMLFFFIVFAIAGLQLWHGILKKRCFNPETGSINDAMICGYYECDAGWSCVEGMNNPNNGATHYDDIFTALLTVFQCVTLEGWTDTQIYTIRAFGPYAIIFYTPLVLIGAFFLVNFTLAVIKSRVTELYAKAASKKPVEEIESNQDAEKKVSMIQIFRQGKATKAGVSKMILLARKLKGNKQKMEEVDRKILYKRVLGFDSGDLNISRDEEMSLEPTQVKPARKDEDTVTNKRPSQEVRDDVIKEVDESPHSISNLNGGNGSWSGMTASERLANMIGRPLGSLASGYKLSTASDVTNQKVLVRGKNGNQKLYMSGILGIKAYIQTGGIASMAEELEEFTEENGIEEEVNPSRSPSPALQGGLSDDKKKRLPSNIELSYSMADLEESRLPTPRNDIPTPKNDPVSSPKMNLAPQGSPPPPEAEAGIHQSQSLAHPGDGTKTPVQNTSGTKTKPAPSFKEQNTMSSLTSSLADGPANKLCKLRSHQLPMCAFKSEDHLKVTTPPKNDSPILLNDAHEAEAKKDFSTTQPIGEPSKEGQGQEEQKNIEEDRLVTEKFIFRDNEIAVTSAADVIPGKMDEVKTKVMMPRMIAYVKPPYKIKLNYVPTELPPEDDEDDQSALPTGMSLIDAGRSTIKGDEIPSLAEGSVTDCKLSRGLTIGSKGRKSKKGKKGKKKGKKSSKPGDNESRLSSNTGKAKVSGDKDSMKLPGRTSSKGNIESASVAGSIDTATKGQLPEVGDGQEKKEEILPVKVQIEKSIKEEEDGTKRELKWSGQEVSLRCDPYAAVYATSYMQNVRVWKHGWRGALDQARYHTKGIVMSTVLENFMNLLVIVNTIMLAMDRYGQSASEDSVLGTVNIVFTGVFAAELVAKLFALGISKYFGDSLNYLDFAVVMFSLMEIVFLNGQGALSAFRSLRIFRAVRMIRTLRVLRVARLLRSLRSMQMIIEVIGKTISSFAYIGLLLIIFIFIYSLFGMQLFGGQFNFSDGKPRQNFDSFNDAFMSMFQVLTMENWQSLLYCCMRAQTPALSAIYLVTWIFIGNYILLNLFLAVMLDAFSEVDDEMGKDNEYVMLFFYIVRNLTNNVGGNNGGNGNCA